MQRWKGTEGGEKEEEALRSNQRISAQGNWILSLHFNKDSAA